MAVLRDRKKTRRWFNALAIAKAVFWHEGYHTRYLEEIEEFIWRKRMYSPKIKEEFIPKLFQLSRHRKMPMTKLVNNIIGEYLKKQEKKKAREVASENK